MGLNFLYLFLCPFFARVSILHEKLHQALDRENLTQDEILVLHQQFLEVSLYHRLSPIFISTYPSSAQGLNHKKMRGFDPKGAEAEHAGHESFFSERNRSDELTVEKGFGKNLENCLAWMIKDDER
jgi:hypothetical protein